MNKKTISIILIMVGAALLLGSVVFVLDDWTTQESVGIGEQIIKILGLLIGAGTGIKGWLDLRKESSLAGEQSQEAIDSPDSEQTMETKGGVQKQKSVRSSGSKQTIK